MAIRTNLARNSIIGFKIIEVNGFREQGGSHTSYILQGHEHRTSTPVVNASTLAIQGQVTNSNCILKCLRVPYILTTSKTDQSKQTETWIMIQITGS